MARKFKSKKDLDVAVHEIEWESRISTDSHYFDEVERKLADVKHNTDALDDAKLLFRLFKEKIERHNAICKQTAGKMKQPRYIHNNVYQ